MNISKFIPNAMQRFVGSKSLVLQKNSPHILFGVGLAGVAVGTVLACRSTLKLEGTLVDIQRDLDDMKTLEEQGQTFTARERAYPYVKGTLEIGKLYAPAIIVMGVSVTALTGSHIQLNRRNAALSAAYAGLHEAFGDYRKRVQTEIGEEKERDIYHGVVTEKETIDGKNVKTTKVVPHTMSPYARIFDENNHNWQPNAETNRVTLQALQNYANHRLQARGHVFLNEVLSDLGFEPTKAGQLVGWHVDSPVSDHYIDFGIYTPENARFVNGYENAVWLDFNVDGPILDLL